MWTFLRWVVDKPCFWLFFACPIHLGTNQGLSYVQSGYWLLYLIILQTWCMIVWRIDRNICQWVKEKGMKMSHGVAGIYRGPSNDQITVLPAIWVSYLKAGWYVAKLTIHYIIQKQVWRALVADMLTPFIILVDKTWEGVVCNMCKFIIQAKGFQGQINSVFRHQERMAPVVHATFV